MIPPPVYPAFGGINVANYKEVRPSWGGALARFVRRAERQVGG